MWKHFGRGARPCRNAREACHMNSALLRCLGLLASGEAPRAGLEGPQGARPAHGFRKRPARSRRAGSRPRTATSGPVCPGSTAWPAGRPGPARDAVGGVAPWRAPDLPAGTPVSLAPAGRASLEQALRRPEGGASDAALRQGVRPRQGGEVQAHTRSALGRPRFTPKRQGARPRHPHHPGGQGGRPRARSRPPAAGPPARQHASPPGLSPGRTPRRPRDESPPAPHRSGRAADGSRPARRRVVRGGGGGGADHGRPVLPGTAGPARGALPQVRRPGHAGRSGPADPPAAGAEWRPHGPAAHHPGTRRPRQLAARWPRAAPQCAGLARRARRPGRAPMPESGCATSPCGEAPPGGCGHHASSPSRLP
jgi:hypothetical protein